MPKIAFLKILLSAFSIIILLSTASAQKFHPGRKKLRVEGIRIGIDPIKSSSIFFPERNPDKHLFYARSFEGNVELLVNGRTSFVTEAGYSTFHTWKHNFTLDYFSKGYYGRVGLNFRLNDSRQKHHSGIGWRVGVNQFTEKRFIRLQSETWDSELTIPSQNIGSSLWGEVLLYHDQPLFSKKQNFLKNIWAGISLRLKLMNRSISGDEGDHLPGYNPNKKIMGGINFRVFYHFPVRRIKVENGRL